MKVYELIKELSQLPAGADVEFRTLMTLVDFSQAPVADTDETGRDLYLVSGNIYEVSAVNDHLVALYK